MGGVVPVEPEAHVHSSDLLISLDLVTKDFLFEAFQIGL